jgi:hypothetical protein
MRAEERRDVLEVHTAVSGQHSAFSRFESAGSNWQLAIGRFGPADRSKSFFLADR